MTDRFFYHSFPQHADPDDLLELGLNVMRSIIGAGLLLTPEIVEWREWRIDGPSAPTMLAAKSISFTELSLQSLLEHSKRYGPFAIEFSPDDFLALGGLPVLYLPPIGNERKGLDGVGAAMLHRIGEIQNLLELLDSIGHLDDQGYLDATRDGQTVPTRIPTVVAKELIPLLEIGESVTDLLNALRAFLGLVYKADEGIDDERLKHYREREWRILSGIVANDVTITRELTEEEKEGLVAMNEAFFTEVLAFRTGPARRVDQCQLFQAMDGREVISYASRIICPEAALEEVSGILEDAELGYVPVVALETLGHSPAG